MIQMTFTPTQVGRILCGEQTLFLRMAYNQAGDPLPAIPWGDKIAVREIWGYLREPVPGRPYLQGHNGKIVTWRSGWLGVQPPRKVVEWCSPRDMPRWAFQVYLFAGASFLVQMGDLTTEELRAAGCATRKAFRDEWARTHRHVDAAPESTMLRAIDIDHVQVRHAIAEAA
jgi:hypothetical protein